MIEKKYERKAAPAQKAGFRVSSTHCHDQFCGKCQAFLVDEKRENRGWE